MMSVERGDSVTDPGDYGYKPMSIPVNPAVSTGDLAAHAEPEPHEPHDSIMGLSAHLTSCLNRTLTSFS